MATALITGASSGIGEAMARNLASRGYSLVLVARRVDRLQALAQELGKHENVSVDICPADLLDRDQTAALIDRATAMLDLRGERLNILINNAGSAVWDAFAEQDEERMQRDIDLNISATTLLTHRFVKYALKQGTPAHVLTVASLAGLLPAPHFAVYSATKSYLISMSEVLSHELRHSNIKVTCTCPGGVQTDFIAQAGQEQVSNLGIMSPEKVAHQAIDAMLEGQVLHVPGMLNKLSSVARFLPGSLRSLLIEKSMALTVRSS